MSIESITAIINTRMTDALERLKNKIFENLSEEVVEEMPNFNIASFVKKAMNGLGEVINEEISKSLSKDTKKTKKDKNAPKGVKNAYIMFCSENREKVKEQHEDMSPKEIISELARLWKETDDEDKTKYQEMAAEDKKRYESEMSDYVPSEDESPKKKSKDKNAPKGAKNAYIMFCSENRDQVKEDNENMSPNDIISELARLWKNTDDDEKAKYQEMAAEDKKRYESEMSDYVPSGDESTKKKSKDKKAPKGAKNAYIIFCSENRDQVKEDNENMSSKEIISELARLWKNTDEEEKARYQELANEDKKRYESEMSDYVPSEGPITSYMLFEGEYRETAKSSHPHAKPNEITKILAEWWKEADQDVKSEFQQKAADANKTEKKEKSPKTESPKKTEEKKEEPKKTESPKKTSKKEETKKTESPKKTSKKEEPKKTEEKKEEPKKTESPKKTSKKEESKKTEEPKKTSKKEEPKNSKK